MGHKHSSLAFDETLTEFETDFRVSGGFEPELTVLVNAHYANSASKTAISTNSDIVQVSGRITVSF